MMIVERKITINDVDPDWDLLIDSPYHKKDFLQYLEKHNNCNQRYYQLMDDGKLIAAAMVYSLKVDLLTFFKYANFHISMNIVGIPLSVDANPFIGRKEYFNKIIDVILKEEKGLIVCLNYLDRFNINRLVEVLTLPTLIFNNRYKGWNSYLASLRHKYRRKVKRNRVDFSEVKKVLKSNKNFNKEHYRLYMNVMNNSQTKLEILSKSFFENLPDIYRLHSFYYQSKLIAWHLTIKHESKLYFLFTGIDYEYRDQFSTYFNVLSSVLEEGITMQCDEISFGQTSEYAKSSLGAFPSERKMFLYHKSRIILRLLNVFKDFISYKDPILKLTVFKELSYENTTYQAKTI